VNLTNIPELAWPALSCPQCGGSLARAQTQLTCMVCQTHFSIDEKGTLDLRLNHPKKISFELELGTPLAPPGFDFGPLKPKLNPEVAISARNVPWHITPELLSYFPHATSGSSLALDLGCGSGLHRHVCERAGFRWVGLDYTASGAPIRGDGHALPFRDATFEFVFSMAVLEHIRYPFVVAREVFRILKPGGFYIGTVAFLEPFHGDSYYHHTHLGTYNTLNSAGFDVQKVAPNAAWSGLKAQATMGGLFPRIPAPFGRALVWPLELLHRLWWTAGRLFSSNADEVSRLVTNTAAFEFVARKPR
jgi:SAM-dependent methyltransferase